MLDNLGYIIKNKLIEIGFSEEEINAMINNKVLNNLDGKYMIADIDLFNVLTLNKVLEFERSILIISELDYLGISDFNKERLYSYGIASACTDEKIKITGDVNKLLSRRDEIDILIYKKLYNENIDKNNILAREYLLKYIEICDAFNIEDDFYYKLYRLNNKIFEESIPYYIKDEYDRLKSDYKTLSNTSRIHKITDASYKLNNLISSSFTKYHIAKSKYVIKDYNGAVRWCKKALKDDKYNVGAYRLLGKSYLMCNDYKNALESTKKYIELDKNTRCDAYNQLFMCYLSLNDIDGAYDVYNYAISVIPQKRVYEFINYAKIKCVQKVNSFNASEIKNVKQVEKLQELLSTISKEVNFDYSDFINDDKNNIEILNEIEKLLEPDENNYINLKKIDDYIDSIDTDIDNKNLIMIDTALILANNNYIDKSSALLKKVINTKNKSEDVKEKICEVNKKIKIIKHRF